MSLLHFIAAIAIRLSRIVAADAFARVAESSRSDSMGVYRPLPSRTFTA